MTITKVGAVIWTTSKVEAVLEFYRALGIPLAEDTHDEPGGPTHFEADVGETHFAVFPAKGDALSSGAQAATLIGLQVDNLAEVIEAVERLGAPIRTPLEDTPWGQRIVAIDPDGRAVEIYQPRD